MFTLKVIHDVKTGLIRPDPQHEFGGTDLLQVYAFRHLFPEGYCKWEFRSSVDELAGLHGWAVEVRRVNKTPEETLADMNAEAQ